MAAWTSAHPAHWTIKLPPPQTATASAPRTTTSLAPRTTTNPVQPTTTNPAPRPITNPAPRAPRAPASQTTTQGAPHPSPNPTSQPPRPPNRAQWPYNLPHRPLSRIQTCQTLSESQLSRLHVARRKYPLLVARHTSILATYQTAHEVMHENIRTYHALLAQRARGEIGETEFEELMAVLLTERGGLSRRMREERERVGGVRGGVEAARGEIDELEAMGVKESWRREKEWREGPGKDWKAGKGR